jgi:hypothetical protein
VLLIFENASDAADFAAQKDDGFWDFGRHGQQRKLQIYAVKDTSYIPTDGEHLNIASYVKERKEANQMQSRTILIENFDCPHVIKQVKHRHVQLW